MSAVRAVFLKELRSELRSKSGLYTAGLFAVVTVVALALAGMGRSLGADLASGIVWVAILFASVVALPRSFVAEEEQGTGDLLRLMAPPHAVFWGKAIFNFGFLAVIGLAVSTIYIGMANVDVPRPDLFALTVVGGCAALSGTVTLCGALVAQAQNRGMLAGAIALPLLVPFVFLGVAAMRLSLGAGVLATGWTSILGVWMYGVAAFALGTAFFESIWKA